MKVLIVAPLLDPEAVGEPTWCLDLARELTSRVEAVILTQTPYNRSFKVAELFPGVEVHECASWPTSRIHTRLDALAKPNVFKFLRFARSVIRDKLDLSRFDCAHQFGPLAPRYPSPLRNFPIPYAIGPLGGALQTPPALTATESHPWYYKLRDVDGLRFARDPFLRATYAKADAVVGVADYVKDVLAGIPIRRFETCPQRAAAPAPDDWREQLAARSQRDGPVRLLSVGRVIFTKGLSFALEALAQVDRETPDWRWEIVGDGDQRAALEARSRELGLADKITFHGHQKRSDVDAFYRSADIFLFPSIREPSGSVVFEAMTNGLPQVVANYGGPGSYVTEDLGLRVDVASERGFIDGLAAALTTLIRDPGRRARLGEAAFHAASDKHQISNRGDFFLNLYGEISAGQTAAARPQTAGGDLVSGAL